MLSDRPRARYAACTVVARNYIAFARVLEASFRRTNPGIDFVTLVIDGTEADRVERPASEIFLLGDLGLEPEVLEPMVAMYSVMELATALKPAMLQALVNRGYEAVAYFDPDIWVLADLGDIFEDARVRGTVLTPHALAPIARDGLEISEKTIMHAGIFNLGFIAVGAESDGFLAWWHERLRTDAVVDFTNALFTDQRWIDWVPALFKHMILRDPGLNVAYWNASERPFTQDSGGGLLAAGMPLRFFHFSGFDLTTPWLLSRFMGAQPRVLLSEHPLLKELCVAYAHALVAEEHQRHRATAYGFDTIPGGPVLTPAVRRLYREAVTGRLPLSPPPARPLSDPAALVRWLATPVQCAPWTRLAPADIALWRSRTDLQTRFPSVLGAASLYFRLWLDADPSVADFYRDLRLGEPESSLSGSHHGVRRGSGWSVVACGEPEPSGEAKVIARRVAGEAARAGVPWELVERAHTGRGAAAQWAHYGVGAHQVHDSVVVCVDAEHFSEDRIAQALAGRDGRRVGLWLSARTTVPTAQAHVLDMFEELWVLSVETGAMLAAVTVRPVRLVRLPWGLPEPRSSRGAATRWLADVRGSGPVFLLLLDAGADFEQQNAAGSIRAFQLAFDPQADARLVIVVRHGGLTRQQAEMVRHTRVDRADILLAPAGSDEFAEGALVEQVDGVLSLHRSAAFAPVLAAAAACGTPIVTTGYSAPTTYLDEHSALLVPYTLVERAHEPGQPADVWAEPDVVAASQALRVVVDDPARVARMVERARSLAVNAPPLVADRIRQCVLGTTDPTDDAPWGLADRGETARESATA